MFKIAKKSSAVSANIGGNKVFVSFINADKANPGHYDRNSVLKISLGEHNLIDIIYNIEKGIKTELFHDPNKNANVKTKMDSRIITIECSGNYAGINVKAGTKNVFVSLSPSELNGLKKFFEFALTKIWTYVPEKV